MSLCVASLPGPGLWVRLAAREKHIGYRLAGRWRAEALQAGPNRWEVIWSECREWFSTAHSHLSCFYKTPATYGMAVLTCWLYFSSLPDTLGLESSQVFDAFVCSKQHAIKDFVQCKEEWTDRFGNFCRSGWDKAWGLDACMETRMWSNWPTSMLFCRLLQVHLFLLSQVSCLGRRQGKEWRYSPCSCITSGDSHGATTTCRMRVMWASLCS